MLIIRVQPIAGTLWFAIPVSLYSFVGNYAPFFEIGIGAYLDGRRRIQWLMPLLIFLFSIIYLICLKAFFDLVVGKVIGKTKSDWGKTEHSGMGAVMLQFKKMSGGM